MRFFIIEPEASGSASSGVSGAPSGGVKLVFDYWLGDDLVRAYPALLVTEPVKTALEGLDEAAGFTMAEAIVTTSAFYREHNPPRTLPTFWAIDVHGHPGRDDMGLTRKASPSPRIAGEWSEGMLFDIGFADGVTPVLAVPERMVLNGVRAG